MARKHVDPTSPAEIGNRLALTRRALGYTLATMSSLMGSATAGQAFENYEAGRRRISLDHALALCRTCGLTLAWIYQGQMDTLPAHVREKIEPIISAKKGQPTTLKTG